MLCSTKYATLVKKLLNLRCLVANSLKLMSFFSEIPLCKYDKSCKMVWFSCGNSWDRIMNFMTTIEIYIVATRCLRGTNTSLLWHSSSLLRPHAKLNDSPSTHPYTMSFPLGFPVCRHCGIVFNFKMSHLGEEFSDGSLMLWRDESVLAPLVRGRL